MIGKSRKCCDLGTSVISCQKQKDNTSWHKRRVANRSTLRLGNFEWIQRKEFLIRDHSVWMGPFLDRASAIQFNFPSTWTGIRVQRFFTRILDMVNIQEFRWKEDVETLFLRFLSPFDWLKTAESNWKEEVWGWQIQSIWQSFPSHLCVTW